MFGKGPARYEPLELAPNLFTAHVQPDPALHEYAMRKLRFEALFSLVFENDAVRRFLEVIPGMNELLLLGKAFDLERETSDGRPTWDTVVVDAPATGHGISLLRLPQVILEVVEQGPMAEEARQMRALLEDTQRTAMVVVSLLEEMPVRETLELYETAHHGLRMPMGPLIVNRVWPDDLCGDRSASWLDQERLPELEPALQAQLEALDSSVRRAAWQREHLRTLQNQLHVDPLLLPELPRGTFDQASILTLAETIDAALTLHPSPSLRSAP